MDQNQMRIQVNPDGNVEFSVALSNNVDPSLVASMVAAVRRGIVASSPPPPPPPEQPPPPATPPQLPQQTPISARTPPSEQHPEPKSDPDRDTARAPDRNCERVPSPLVVSAARKLSVRQIAAEIDARPDSTLPNPYSEFDPVREFSSSPALWTHSNSPSYIEPDPPKSQSSAYSLRAAAIDGDITPPKRIRDGERSTTRVTPQKPKSRQAISVQQFPSSRPVRMLSLPSGTNHENIDDMYVLRRQSEHTADQNPLDQHILHRENTESLDLINEGEILVEERSTECRHHPVDQHDNDRNPARSQRSISDLTDSHGLEAEGDRPVTPSSPYVQQQAAQEEDPNDAWDNVEYVLTESYRNEPRESDGNDRDSRAAPSTPRSAAWRLFSSIGLRRRQDNGDDVHQSTLATRSGYSDKLTKRRRALFARNNVRHGMLWMEFTSSLGAERMLAEVGKISKAMGYQVWRRPGENKLRCIRRLNHRHEMHLVILVGSIRLPEGQMSVVRLRRARGDRNRTEGWRYAHFYRELIDRLQRHGVEITAGE